MKMFNPEDHTEGSYKKSDEMKQLETPEDKIPKVMKTPESQLVIVDNRAIALERIAKQLQNINNELHTLNKTLRRK